MQNESSGLYFTKNDKGVILKYRQIQKKRRYVKITMLTHRLNTIKI